MPQGGPIRVLVVDDSAVVREMISDIVSKAPGMEVAGTARDGREAIEMVQDVAPDVVTLDVQMPRMNGLETLDALLERGAPPVIMVSTLTQRGADTTFQALERGALDYIGKPVDGVARTVEFDRELEIKIRNLAGADVKRVLRIRKNRAERQQFAAAPAPLAGGTAELLEGLIAVGISTGGPPALSRVISELRPPLPPIAIVQHMPANFTGPFAKRLDSISVIEVKEAEDGDVLRPNAAWLAPGGRHMKLTRCGGKTIVRVFDDEPVSGHRPSVDVMMTSAVEAYRDKCLGVIMTGMGRDGADGCVAIRRAGGYVLGQDEATSDVYGMNKVAFSEGGVDQQFALEEFPLLVAQRARKMFRAAPALT